MAEADEFPASALLEAHGKILERMADGADLRETLTSIALLVEQLAPPALCSVVMLVDDGKHLKPVAAPSLPEAYNAAIDGVEIGPCAGSCGTAAWRKEPVIVTDIATDPLWESPRELALSFGLRACWSLPILRGDGTVLGTIALYYDHPRAPTAKDWGLLAPCARLVRLALAVNRKENELAAAKTAAESANRAKSRFLASTSHELRTPLNAIIGFSDMMRQQVLGPISPHRYADYVEDIHHSGTHLLSLINDVLDMAKIEAEKFELNRRPIDIAAVAEGSLLFVAHQAEKAGVSLKAEVRSGIMLMADERAIRQVLTNLLSNAVKFTPAGGSVRLFGELLANGLFALGVDDTGIGMSDEGLVMALEPFGQVEKDISVKSVGTGLGLPLAKEMIEMHGALFQITSKVGFGTRVWATFPACDVLKSVPATEAVG